LRAKPLPPDGASRHDRGVNDCDFLLVGGGLVGLATARALAFCASSSRIVLLEKEPAVAQHQSGRNSGVLHAGVYYAPGSAKARFCREGREEMLRFCRERGIPHRLSGKLIVAADVPECARLENLAERARANGATFERCDERRIREIEPEAAGLAALHIPESGVVDFGAVARAIAAELADAGVEVRTSAPCVGLRRDGPRTRVFTPTEEFNTRVVVACAGLHADRLAIAAGLTPDLGIVPFRGEYLRIRPPFADRIRSLIYPVPDPSLPFLGVHVTRGIDGSVECGPNAVLAFAREGYRRTDFDLRDVLATLRAPGFARFAWRHARYGMSELHRSFSIDAFTAAARRIAPALSPSDLEPAPSGVRAQAIARDGNLVDDFRIDDSEFGIHVLNAPSPAATASLALGREIAARAARRFRES
jgi:(S)-2-hydroxyglutarate dehydrogenase